MLQKILAAYDGSPSSGKAFGLAMELASKCGAELYVLAVARPPDFGTEVEAEAIIENSRQHCQHLLKPLHEQTANTGITTRFETAIGHPAEQIIYHAETHNVDLIVMGHRGKTLFERLLVGSVAKQVVAHAHCSVMIAR